MKQLPKTARLHIGASIAVFALLVLAGFNASFDHRRQTAAAGDAIPSTVYVSPSGNDANDGSSASPFATVEKAISIIDSQSSPGTIILKSGTYNITSPITIKPPASGSPNAGQTLTIRSEGSAAIDGSVAVDPTPMSGESGIYTVSVSYNGSDLPQIWEEGRHARYHSVSSIDVLRQTDYGAYPISAGEIAIRSAGGGTPSGLRVSKVEYGFVITRSNVTINGITFRNFGKSYSSSGLLVGYSNFSDTIDNVSIISSSAENSYSGFTTLKGTNIKSVRIENCSTRDVATGVRPSGGNVTVSGCKLINDDSSSNLFAFTNPNSQTGGYGIRANDNFGESSTYRDNVIVGFPNGINLSSSAGSGSYLAEHNTIVSKYYDQTGQNSYGIWWARYSTDCASCGKDKAVFRYNIISGFKTPFSVNKTTVTTYATIDRNVFWNSKIDLGNYVTNAVSNSYGDNNVSGDPLFVNESGGDYRVYADSPAVIVSTDGRPAGALGSNGTNSPNAPTAPVTPPSSTGDNDTIPTQSSEVTFTRANQYGFVVYTKNPAADQYISYRKKGSSTWIRGMSNVLYSSVPAYDDAKNVGEQPFAVSGLDANSTYEFMLNGSDTTVNEITTSGSPTTLYVSTSGTDARTGGSRAAPFKTLQYALDMALPGDTITLLSGLYNTRPNVLLHGGSVSAPITIQAENYGGAIMNGQGSASVLLTIGYAQYIRVKNINFQGAANRGLYLAKSSDYAEVTNNIFTNGAIGSKAVVADAIVTRDSDNVNIHNNLVMNWNKGITFNNSPRIKINNNTIFNAIESGIEVGYGSAVAQIIDTSITYNTINYYGNTAIKFWLKNGEESQLHVNYNNYGTTLSTARGTPDSDTAFVNPYSFFTRLSRELIILSYIGGSSKTYVSFKQWKSDTGYDAGSKFADPRWVDPANGDFRLASNSPNILGSNYIGAFGSSGSSQTTGNTDTTTPPDTNTPVDTSILYVSNSGNDATADGSDAKPYKTIQAAVNASSAGKTIHVKAGTYDGFTVSKSGSASSHITIEGETSAGQPLSQVTSGIRYTSWVSAPEIGPNVYKVAIATHPSIVTIEGRKIPLVDDAEMSWTKNNLQAYEPNVTALQIMKNDSTPLTLGYAITGYGSVNYWDVFYGISGYMNGYLYLRLKDGSNPNSRNILVHSHGTGIAISGNYVDVKNMSVLGYNTGISISGSNVNISGNWISASDTRLYISGGSSGDTISGNKIFMDNYGGNAGAWGNGSSFDAAVKEMIYLFYKYMVGVAGSDDKGIALSEAGNDISIYGNEIYGGLIGVNFQSHSRLSYRGKIHDNIIRNNSSTGITEIDGAMDYQIYNNLLYDNNINIRIHFLDSSSSRRIYIYNNRMFQYGDSGTQFFLHWFDGSPKPVTAPEVFMYHNSLSGGDSAICTNAYVKEYGGIPNFYIVNNIFSTVVMFCSTDLLKIGNGVGYFNYNWIGGKAEDFGADWFGGNNVVSIGKTVWSNVTLPDFYNVPTNGSAKAGLDLSKSFTANGRSLGILPGISSGYFSGSAPDIGVFKPSLLNNNPVVADTVPPSISSVQIVSATSHTAAIYWSTDEAASSKISYGRTGVYGSNTATNSALTTSHNMSLTGLDPNTTYHFKIISVDSNGNVGQSGDYSFVTPKDDTAKEDPVNGLCSNTKDICNSGTYYDITDSSTQYLWQCSGKSGGVTAYCAIDKPTAKKNPVIPTIDYHAPAKYYQPPTTNNQRPNTDYQQTVVNNQLPTSFTHNLKRGDTGDEVRLLNITLKALGYKSDISNTFSQNTEDALKAYQTSYASSGIIATGVVDNVTLTLLNSDLKRLNIDTTTGMAAIPDTRVSLWQIIKGFFVELGVSMYDFLKGKLGF